MTKRRKFTAEFKSRVVLELITGKRSPAEACRRHGVKSQLLTRWKREFLENAHRVFEREGDHSEEAAEVAELERLVGRQAMELEILKKTSDFLESPSRRRRRL